MSHCSSRRTVRRALETRRGLVQITIASVLWGTGGIVVRLLHTNAHLDPVSIAFYRLAVAAPVLLAITARHHRLRTDLRTAPGLLTTIGIGLATYQALYFVAVTDVGVSVATMISLGLAPVLVTVGAAITNRRLPTPLVGATVTVASCGLVLVSLGGLHSAAPGSHVLLGLACATGSGVGYAATTVLSRRATAKIDPVSLTTITTAIGAVALAPIAALTGLRFIANGASVLELAYLGPVTTALAYALFYRGLRTTPSSAAAVITLLEPLAAAALATWLLSSPLPATTIVGGILLIGAITSLYLEHPATRHVPE